MEFSMIFEAGADEIMFLMQMGTVPQDVILDSIRGIGEHVIPHLSGVEAAAVGM